MDQSRYWIQKEQNYLNPHVLSSSFGDSWEEQAFAEDAAGPLGGCIWPPRSYTCSFCRREFRSAQALGGHMNVHRRDRARLKKISSPNQNQDLDQPHTSFDICVLPNPNYKICNPNPSFELDQTLYSSSSLRPSTVSILRPFTCSFGQEHLKGTTSLTCSKFESIKRFNIANDDSGNQDKGSAKVLESDFPTSKKTNLENTDQLHLASDLNSLIRRRCYDETPFISTKDDDDEHGGLFSKKRRIEDSGVRSFLPRNSSLLDGYEAGSVLPVCERSTKSTFENLDLELRLGT